MEGSYANGGHTVRDDYVCQTAATREGRSANGGHTVRDDYACQTGAFLEGSCANGGHTVGDNYAYQTVAIREGMCANGGAACDDHLFQTAGNIITIIVRTCTKDVAKVSVACAVFCCSDKWKGYTCQTGATYEGRTANGGHTVRDDNACQTDAFIEGILVDFFYVVRDNQICLFSNIANQNLVCTIGADYVSIFICCKFASTFLRVNIECIVSNITII